MREALDQYYADKNKYPPSLDTLVEDKYIRSIPKDPFTRSTDTWQIELVRAGTGQSIGGTWRLQRQERLRPNGDRRVTIRGLVSR